MASSYLSLGSGSMLPRQTSNCSTSQQQRYLSFSFVVAFLFVGAAIFLAPESPDELASICQKHNSIAACQVW